MTTNKENYPFENADKITADELIKVLFVKLDSLEDECAGCQSDTEETTKNHFINRIEGIRKNVIEMINIIYDYKGVKGVCQ